jgi:tetratricopeptide (TPR) repeat protein
MRFRNAARSVVPHRRGSYPSVSATKGRDWLAFGFAVAGLALSLYNSWVGRATRLEVQQRSFYDLLWGIAETLDEVEAEPNASGRKHSVKLSLAGRRIEQALLIEPRSIQVRRLKAEFLWLAERKDEAIVYCLQAIRDTPDSVIYGELGLLYQKQGRLDEAAESYSKALELRSDPIVVGVVHRNLVRLHVQRGTVEGAIASLELRLARPEDQSAACDAVRYALASYGDLFMDLQPAYLATCNRKE